MSDIQGNTMCKCVQYIKLEVSSSAGGDSSLVAGRLELKSKRKRSRALALSSAHSCLFLTLNLRHFPSFSRIPLAPYSNHGEDETCCRC